MRRGLVLGSLAALLAACPTIPPPEQPQLSSFGVALRGWYQGIGATRTPLAVVSVCASKYGGQAQVPAAEKGTRACPYAMPRGDIEVDVTATALDSRGVAIPDFAQPVSFRIVPGDLTGDYANRWAQAFGGVAQGTVRAAHQFGEVRIWAEHGPPRLVYADGGVGGTIAQLPPDMGREWTWATGLSPAVFFEDPTIAKMQIPDGFDNRTSPLVGEFITIGKAPESGQTLTQSCAADPGRDQKPALMVVTGTDPGGFFVTDVSACRQIEQTLDGTAVVVRNPEPPEACVDVGGGAKKCAISQKTCTDSTQCNRYLPGTFGSMFIYNYSFPDGLDEGDLLWTLAGAVQEFTSTTQLVFPSWTIAEKVRRLPEDQWDKWLKLAPVTTLTARTCGAEDKLPIFLTDALCGHNRRNLKMESLESSLVRLRKVRFPQTFTNCDVDGDVSVPFFCEQTDDQNQWVWGSCAFGEVESPKDQGERTCHQQCVMGQGPWAGQHCAERATFIGFGQFPVMMTGAGLASAGLDDALVTRFVSLPLGTTSTRFDSVPAGAGALEGVRIVIACEDRARYKLGDATVQAGPQDALLLPHTPVYRTVQAGETSIAFVAEGAPAANARCSVGLDPDLHINLMVKDAVPELHPDCDPQDTDAARARQCQLLRDATYDVVGHLRHLQPGRPRWLVIPRDVRDLCCYPGALGECPKPVKPCP